MASRAGPLVSSFSKCISSIMNNLIARTTLSLSLQRLVKESHFSGVVIINLLLIRIDISTLGLSPVTEMQERPNSVNFLCQSTKRSSQSALVGETINTFPF